MRVVLVHNENAGEGTAAQAVRRAIEAAGHRVVVDSPAPASLRELSASDADLIAVAGGDGTVRAAALNAAGRGVPIAVIPLGIANNIAASLGMEGEPEEVVRAWERASRGRLDFGVTRGAFGERRFVESVGWGLVASGIAQMDREAPHAEEGDRDAMLRKAARRFGEVLAELRPRACRLGIDGEEREEELILVEVLCTASVGPRLRLAPASRPGDETLHVVVAGERERDELAGYLRHCELGERTEIELPTRRAERVTLAAAGELHLDDLVLTTSADTPLTAFVDRAAVEVLTLRPR